MVIEDNPSVNLQAFARATILKRLNENIAASGGSEDREPGYDGRSDEMSGARFINAIPTAHGGKFGEAQLRGQVRSQVQLGNESEERDEPDSAEENFVDITPCPIFTRLKGSNDWVPRGVKMFRGVAIRRRVTATHVAARQTKPQVDPERTHR